MVKRRFLCLWTMVKYRKQPILILLLLPVYATTCCSGFKPSLCKKGSFQGTNTRLCHPPIESSNIICAPLQHPQSHPSLKSSTILSLSGQNESESGNHISVLGALGIACQPIAWISLYFVATTGAGLPAGPFGLLGAVEGLSYLLIVGLVASSGVGDKNNGTDTSLSTAQKLSSFTLLVALLTLLSLIKAQGCIPNAKPILDYSSYLPVCNPEDTPGLFGL